MANDRGLKESGECLGHSVHSTHSTHYKPLGGKTFFIHNSAFASERQQDRTGDFWLVDYIH